MNKNCGKRIKENNFDYKNYGQKMELWKLKTGAILAKQGLEK